MGHNGTVPRSFKQKLRSELRQREWGVRTLARAMAERSDAPARVESIRRQLKRYLSDIDTVRPSTATRHSIEDALGLERDALEDDEEGDPAVAEFLEALRPVAVLLARRTEPVLAEERV